MAPKDRPTRRERRAAARAQQRHVRDRDRFARLEPGGSPEHPLVIDSPAVVEVRAAAQPCPLCGGSVQVKEHTAERIGGTRLRAAAVACTQCGAQRVIYFRLSAPPTVH